MKTLNELLVQETVYDSLLQFTEGEITEEQAAALDNLMVEIARKADSYALVVSKMDVREEELKRMRDMFTAAIKSIQGMQERLRERLIEAVKDREGKELLGDNFKIKLQNVKKKLVIHDETKVPIDFYKTEIVNTIDKAKIRAHVELFGNTEFAELVDSFSVKVGVRK